MNKGADWGAEFSGLQAQYLYVLAGGLFSIFLVFVILYMARVNRWFCVLFGTVSVLTLVLMIFRLGRKYGPHGLIRLAAARCRPFHITNRKRIISLFKRGNHEKHPESGNTGK